MGFSVGLDIGALAGGAMTAGGSILQGYWNKEQQEKNLDYQKDLQAQIFGREDNSVQRRVADLKKAGLSPTSRGLGKPGVYIGFLLLLFNEYIFFCRFANILVFLLKLFNRQSSLNRLTKILKP